MSTTRVSRSKNQIVREECLTISLCARTLIQSRILGSNAFGLNNRPRCILEPMGNKCVLKRHEYNLHQVSPTNLMIGFCERDRIDQIEINSYMTHEYAIQRHKRFVDRAKGLIPKTGKGECAADL